jgi:hypothetical protein
MAAASPTLLVGPPKPSPGHTRAPAGLGPAVRRCAGSWQCPGPQPARASAAGVPAGRVRAGISGRRLGPRAQSGLSKSACWAGLWASGVQANGTCPDSCQQLQWLRGKGPTELQLELSMGRFRAAQEPEDHRRLPPRWGARGSSDSPASPLTRFGAPTGRQINRVPSAPGDQSKRSIAGATRSRQLLFDRVCRCYSTPSRPSV